MSRSRDGLRLCCRLFRADVPGATPVLCVGDAGRDTRGYGALALQLAHGRDVACPDPRGTGQSEADPIRGNHCERIRHRDILDMLADLGWTRYVLLGGRRAGELLEQVDATPLQRCVGAILATGSTPDTGPPQGGIPLLGLPLEDLTLLPHFPELLRATCRFLARHEQQPAT